MAWLLYILSNAVDWIMAPMIWLHPWVGMVGVSLLTAIIALFVFKYTSNQAAIQKAKNRIKAHLMAMSLYKDSMRVIVSSALYIILINFKYISLTLVPLLFMIAPFSILGANLDGWYGYYPFLPEEPALLTMKLEDGEVMRDDIRLHCSDGVKLDSPPVRISSAGEISWRVIAKKTGSHYLTVEIGDKKITKNMHVGDVSSRVSLKRHKGAFFESLLYPTEPIAEELPVRSLGLSYTMAEMNLFGWKLHWIYVYLILTLVLALAFKGVFKVTI